MRGRLGKHSDCRRNQPDCYFAIEHFSAVDVDSRHLRWDTPVGMRSGGGHLGLEEQFGLLSTHTGQNAPILTQWATLHPVYSMTSNFAHLPMLMPTTRTRFIVNTHFPPQWRRVFGDLIDRTVWADLEVVRRDQQWSSRIGTQALWFKRFQLFAFLRSQYSKFLPGGRDRKDYENNGSYPHASLLGYVYNDGTPGDGADWRCSRDCWDWT